MACDARAPGATAEAGHSQGLLRLRRLRAPRLESFGQRPHETNNASECHEENAGCDASRMALSADFCLRGCRSSWASQNVKPPSSSSRPQHSRKRAAGGIDNARSERSMETLARRHCPWRRPRGRIAASPRALHGDSSECSCFMGFRTSTCAAAFSWSPDRSRSRRWRRLRPC